MRPQHSTTIVLQRVNYGEADKIVTLLTKDGNKLSAIAKGVRKPKSRLTASVELFCVCDISYVQGRGGMATLTGANIKQQYGGFLSDYAKVQYAYDLIKAVNSLTEQNAGAEHFAVLCDLYLGLEQPHAPLEVLWAWVRLLQLHGRGIQLNKQTNGEPFLDNAKYFFDTEGAGFFAAVSGNFLPEHIKLLRLLYKYPPSKLVGVANANNYAQDLIAPIKQFTLSAT